MNTHKIELTAYSWLKHGEVKLDDYDAERDFDTLWDLHPEEYGKVRMAGIIKNTARWQQAYLRGYDFSGVFHEALPLPEEFQPFLDWANALIPDKQFNQVLINWYMDGSHYIGPHSDDERPLVSNSPIVSISLGQERTFRIRYKYTKDIVQDIRVKNLEYLVMGGDMQREFTHEIVKVSGKKGAKLDRRISITFRIFKDDIDESEYSY